MSDPVEAGLVANLARPGGNVTGQRSLSVELSGKRLELLKESFPKISRVAVLGVGKNPGGRQQVRGMEAAAQVLGLELRHLDWKRPNPDFQRLSRAITEMRASALTMTSGPWQLDHLTQILDLSTKSRLPAIYPNGAFADAGGLLSYGIDWEYFHRRAAYYVDKILKGAKPADLPMEQATKIELVINLKTAKALGFTIPPQVLMDADRVIR
jgi:putative tryptophan/tyrosine transport system substrate-binding protein